jgi:phosphatidate cytidylyltransferase
MSYLDPYAGSTDPRGWERPDEPHGHERAGGPPGRGRPDGGDDPRPRARRANAVPETYVDRSGYDAEPPYRNGGGQPGRGRPGPDEPYPGSGNGYPGPDEPYYPAPGNGYAGPDEPYPVPGSGYAGPDQPYPVPGSGYAGPDQPYPVPGNGYPGSDDQYGGSGSPHPAPGRPHRGPAEPFGDSDDGYTRPHRQLDERFRPPAERRPPYPGEDDDHDAAGGGAAAPTNPIGWPVVEEPEPSPPQRRGPGRRRATRDRPATQPASNGRAGRNLPAAIGVGVGLGALVVIPLLLLRPAFFLVVGAAVTVGIWEMSRAVRHGGSRPPLVPLIAGGLLMIGLAWWAGPDALSLGLLVTVLAAMVWRLGDGPAGFQRDLTAIALIAVYVPFLGGFAVLLAVPPDGHLRVLVTLVAVVLSDTGGYAAGVAFGKHPMAPSVSPKKSWEGFGGSVLAAAVGSALLLWLLLDVAPWWGAVFGLAIAGAAVLGDLGESMIKRDLGIKDMSNLLPGHGGLMDRLDSVLFAVPTAYLLLAIFAPAG